jgi:glycosyltransferase involved in cell wall biosynthesis
MHLVQLLEAWQKDGTLQRHAWVLFASPQSEAALRSALPEAMSMVEVVVFQTGRGLGARFVQEQIRLPRQLSRRRIDVLLCPGNVMPYATKVPVVAALQNAAPFCESVTPRTVGWGRWLRFALVGVFMRLTARRARKIIFLSEFFRGVFESRFGFARDRGRVIPHAGGAAHIPPANREIEARFGLRRPYVISVSHLNPYKNTVELIEGFAAGARDFPSMQLVLVGMANFPHYLQRIHETTEKCGLKGRVVLTGELPHGEAMALVAGSEAFVFTSTCENCPIALIEAFSAGVPVASSNLGVMTEIAGDAALLFDPYRPSEIGDAIHRMLSDSALRQELRQRSLARSLTFLSHDAVARATLEALEAATTD